ncbi:MltA domain-containing protein [Chryseobacterium sp. SIMBA_029]|uniref:MltA domain-containing protein n=1 Tax=Chryseobacterium sp. SIMBA_029 TaxID=3085772 RepID=UPI00397BBB66
MSAYPDRRAIDQGILSGRGLEIAWAKSKVDVFFVHVQGAARLRYPDGTMGRIT